MDYVSYPLDLYHCLNMSSISPNASRSFIDSKSRQSPFGQLPRLVLNYHCFGSSVLPRDCKSAPTITRRNKKRLLTSRENDASGDYQAAATVRQSHPETKHLGEGDSARSWSTALAYSTAAPSTNRHRPRIGGDHLKRMLMGQRNDGPSHFRISLKVTGPPQCRHQSCRLLAGPWRKPVVWEKFFCACAVGVSSSRDEDKINLTKLKIANDAAASDCSAASCRSSSIIVILVVAGIFPLCATLACDIASVPVTLVTRVATTRISAAPLIVTTASFASSSAVSVWHCHNARPTIHCRF